MINFLLGFVITLALLAGFLVVLGLFADWIENEGRQRGGLGVSKVPRRPK